MRVKSLLAGVVFAGLLCGNLDYAVASTVPMSFSHHGLLYNGKDLANGEFTITATLYNGDGEVIKSKEEKVSVFDGFYNFTIDDIDEEKVLKANGKMELGIKVGTNDEMSPRLPINSVPFAILSSHADRADDLQCEGCVTLEQLSPSIQNGITGTAGIYPAKAYGTFQRNSHCTSGECSYTYIVNGQNYEVSGEEIGVYEIKFKSPMDDANYTVILDINFYDEGNGSDEIVRTAIENKTKDGFTIRTRAVEFSASSKNDKISISYSWEDKNMYQGGGGSQEGTSAKGAPISFVVY